MRFLRSSEIRGLPDDLRQTRFHLKHCMIILSKILWNSLAIRWLSGTILVTPAQFSLLIRPANLELPSGVILRYSGISHGNFPGLVRRDSTVKILRSDLIPRLFSKGAFCNIFTKGPTVCYQDIEGLAFSCWR